MLLRSCLSVVDDEYIEELMERSENENGKSSTEYRKNDLKKWRNERKSKQI